MKLSFTVSSKMEEVECMCSKIIRICIFNIYFCLKYSITYSELLYAPIIKIRIPNKKYLMFVNNSTKVVKTKIIYIYIFFMFERGQ